MIRTSTDTLWLKFSEESVLPEHIDPEQQARLNRIFDVADPASPWRKALARLGITPDATVRHVRWVGPVIYINWCELVRLMSGGAVTIERGDGGAFQVRTSRSILKNLYFARRQWAVSSYISRISVGMYERSITESLSLGLAILALRLRTGQGNERELANALRDPSKQSFIIKDTLETLQTIQKIRTELSPLWTDELGGNDAAHGKNNVGAYEGDLPASFWNDDIPKKETYYAASLAPPHIRRSHRDWEGIAISGHGIAGKAVLVRTRQELDEVINERSIEPLIAICPKARPETVELFPYIAGILYGEGGAMSHAATVAREQNLPCVTALGGKFIEDMAEYLASNADLWLSVDPADGKVSVAARE